MVQAQEPVAERFFNLAPGVGFTAAQDLGMTPMVFSGAGPQLELSVQKRKKTFSQSWQVVLEYASVRTQSKSSVADRVNAQINYTALWDVLKNKSERLDFRFGVSFLNQIPTLIHRSYYNNNYNFAFMSSLGPAGYIEMPLKLLNRDCKLHGTIDLPLIAAIERPAFAYGGPAGFYDYEKGKELRDAWQSLEVHSLDAFLRIKTRVALSYPLFNKNRLEIGYDWDFYRINTIPENRVASGRHGFYFMTQFNF